MRTCRHGETTTYCFSRLGGAGHALSTRLGGSSAEPFKSLNLSFRVGDDASAVARNRRLFCEASGISPESVVCAQQVHGTAVRRVRAGEFEPSGWQFAVVPEVDALITDESGVALWLAFADCAPVLLHDPILRTVGIAHAGWRGALAGVAANTVRAMVEQFGCEPSDIRAGIGPAIGPCCYEVGPEVVEAARSSLPSFPSVVLWADGGREHLDLPEVNRQFLLQAGLLPERIELSGLCTACHTDLFFSHRAEHGRTGRHAAAIWLEN